MNIILRFLRHLCLTYQIKNYGNKIPFFTIREFGPKNKYTQHEADTIIKRWNLNSRYIQVAYAILLTEKDFIKALKCKGLEYDYSQIRQQIAKYFFEDDIEFTICDLLYKSYYRTGANRKLTPLSAEWRADASYFECLHSCYKKELFKNVKYFLHRGYE
jgi:hypothetical protein